MPSADRVLPDRVLPDWARAHGKPLAHGAIKQSPADFRVNEVLGFTPTGTGEHDFLLVEKTNLNTTRVAAMLAQHAAIAVRDVGFAGMKDRRAITQQWFSVRRPAGTGTDWNACELAGIRILDRTRSNRKLKRGAHSSNHFRLLVRLDTANDERLVKRLEKIAACGVPNYFGRQRFGRNANNLALAQAVFAGQRLRRDQRSIAISAARSFLFNEVLSTRVANGSWNELLDGEAVNLDGTGSFFVPDEVDDALRARLNEFDVHPTGPLWGKGDTGCVGAVAVLEQAIGNANDEIVNGLTKAGVRADRRALRMPVHEFSWKFSDRALEIQFRLGKGCFATMVLREFMTTADV